ncbi:hypothetical protein M3Y99_01453800 [Aphelenchoides fujianensis]|nr:hypothetical protein M3Y99_01453800 [Aphelenchoides fujianensis]
MDGRNNEESNEEVRKCVFWTHLIHSVVTICQTLRIPQNPLLWTVAQVHAWLRLIAGGHSLPLPFPLPNLAGRRLASMRMAEWVQSFGNGGVVLFYEFRYWSSTTSHLQANNLEANFQPLENQPGPSHRHDSVFSSSSFASSQSSASSSYLHGPLQENASAFHTGDRRQVPSLSSREVPDRLGYVDHNH